MVATHHCRRVLLATVVVLLAVAATPVAAAADDPAVHLSTTADGRFTEGPPITLRVVEAAGGRSTLDLTALDPAQYRGDLVRVRLLVHDGPGRVAVTVPWPLGGAETVLDTGTGDNELVAPVGRALPLTWTFTETGTHRVDLELAAPLASGGSTTVIVRHHIDVTVATAPAPVNAPATGSRALGEAAISAQTAAPATAGAPFAAQQTAHRVVIDRGHVDMGPRIVEGAWRIQLKDDSVSPALWRDLADVVLHARESSAIELPTTGDQYSFLGAPGATVYVLPQVQQSDLVWPGWNTQDPSTLAAVPGSTTWRLVGVDGPGRFVLYLAGSFGQTEVLFDSGEGLPQELTIERNTHVHGNWAFTEPGIYRVTVEMAAASTSGAVLTDRRVLTVAVGDDVDPSTAFTPPSPGTGSTSTTTTTSTTRPTGPTGSVTAQVPGPGVTGGRGTGAIADTGLAAVGPTVVTAAALITVGVLLRQGAARRRRSVDQPI